jgi:hypothetical protein
MLPRQLEKSNLGTIHLNAISRIYGEHGTEILGTSLCPPSLPYCPSL